MYKMILFCLILVLGLQHQAAADSNLEDQLRKTYLSTERMLRHWYDADTLKFDSSGYPKKADNEGYWALLSGVVIQDVRLKPGKLELHGHRRLLTFDGMQKQIHYVKSDRSIVIEVETHEGPDQAAQLTAALDRVFVPSSEDIASLLPDYWQDFMARFSGKKTDGTACEGSKAKEEEGAAPAASPVQVSAGIADGLKVQDAMPYYPHEARINGVRGELVLRAVIDKNGDVSRVCIVQALGAGLDDVMVNTVRKWKYRPYLLNGQPVEIQTTIRAGFGVHLN